MEREARGRHDIWLAVLGEWLASLPPGLAEMRAGAGARPDHTRVIIRPLRNPDAAEITVEIEKQSGRFIVRAGQYYEARSWDYVEVEPQLLTICHAIAMGGLTEILQLLNGRPAGCWVELMVEGEMERVPYLGHTSAEAARYVWRWLRGGQERRVIRYPGYDQAPQSAGRPDAPGA